MKEVIIHKRKVGSGTYACVYKGSLEIGEKKLDVAIKRNFCENELTGIGCIRELSYLNMLRDHPFIISLRNIYEGNPFENRPLTPIGDDRSDIFREDSHHFVLDYAPFNLTKYIKSSPQEYDNMKIIMAQILLAMEYMHSRRIMHMDIKPENILVTIEENEENEELPISYICDFGIACVSNNYVHPIQGLQTSWYRAPEVHGGAHYSYPADIWGIGCVFYEMVTGSPFFKISEKNENKNFLTELLKLLPEDFDSVELKSYFKKAGYKNKNFIYNSKYIDKKDFYTRLRTLKKKGKRVYSDSDSEDNNLAIDIEKFEETGGTLEEFCEVLNGCLQLKPEKRLTATQLLELPFFESLKPYIEEFRKEYPPENRYCSHVQNNIEVDYKIEIIDCLERRMAANVIINLYNNREQYFWYDRNIIFGAMTLFDKYLAYEMKHKSKKLRKKAKKGIGRLHNEFEIKMVVWTCIYIMYKIFSVLDLISNWSEIFPKYLLDTENEDKFKAYEEYIVVNVCHGTLLSPTFLDYLSDDFQKYENWDSLNKNYVRSEEEMELDVKNCLWMYCGYEGDFCGSMKEFYEFLK